MRFVSCATTAAWIVLASVSVSSVAVARTGVRRMPPHRGDVGELMDDPAKLGQETRAFDAAYKSFKQAAAEYRGDVRQLISGEIDRRKKKLSDTYQTQIDKIDKEQMKLRREAIARLEAFIYRHREHPKYTPDAMFRLAELYYEDAEATAAYAEDHYEELKCLYERGKLLDPPTQEEPNYARSIALYQYLHWVPPGTKMLPLAGKLKGVILPKRWPNYRHADAALYLQGFCEQRMGNFEQAIATYRSISDHYPKSRYVPEAWLRVGEIFFEDGEYEPAAEAYKKAAKFAKANNNDEFYALSLYKLGWSYFNMYQYPQAVSWFQRLIEFSDRKGKQSKRSSNLRKEAIEYLAKSLTEPRWDEDECDDFGGMDGNKDCYQVDPRLRPRLYVSCVIEPDFKGFESWQSAYEGEPLATIQKNVSAREQVRKMLLTGDKPYVREILTIYAQTLMEFAAPDQYRQALMVYRYMVTRWPLDRDAQKAQREVISLVTYFTQQIDQVKKRVAANPNKQEALLELAMAREAQDAAIAERRRYLRMFAPGSPWHEKWGKDKDLVRQVEEFSAKLRLEFAQLTLQSAQTLKEAGKTEEALAKYREAAVEYEKLLKADPEGEKAYEFLWTLAEIYFFAGEKCDALRDANGELLRLPKGEMKGELVPHPVDQYPLIRKACDTMAKSLPLYDKIRDWKGPKGKDDEGKPIDHTVEAAASNVVVREKILEAYAAFPLTDAEGQAVTDRLPTRTIPAIRPDMDKDLEIIERNQKELEASKGQKTNITMARQDIPERVVRWIQAVDRYVAGKHKYPEDPTRNEKFALKAAELLYKNRNFDPWKEQPYKELKPSFFSARERFRKIIENYPKTTASAEAAKNLLTSYQMEVDVENMKKVAKWLDEKGLAPKDTLKEIKQTLRTIFLGSIAVKAEALHEKAKILEKDAKAATDRDQAFALHKKARAGFKAAAREYRRLQHETDKTQVKLTSLLNAVTLYQKAEEWDESFATFDEAEKMLRDINAKPTTPASEKKENVKRLINVIDERAKLQFRFYRLTDAIANFREVYNLAPKSKKGREAIQNAALLAYRNSNWTLAIELNKTLREIFRKDFKHKIVWDEANKRIVDAYKQLGNESDYINALKTQIKLYEREKAASAQVFRAWAEIARIYRANGKKRDETKIWQMLIKDFERRGLEKNGGAEATVVAEAQFRLMEPVYNAYMAKKLKLNKRLPANKRMKDLQKQLIAMMDEVLGPAVKTKDKDTGQVVMQRGGGLFDKYYANVATYRSTNWSYAAFLYRAQALVHLSRTIYNAPRPENMSEDAEEAYEEFLEKFGGQLENKAISSLEIAIKQADKRGAVNEWVNKLRVAINRYKPQEYPLLKEARRLPKFPDGTDTGVEEELR